MILQGDETFAARHARVVIADFGKDDAVDFLSQRIALGDDFHDIPIVLIAVSHGFVCGSHLLGGFLPILVDDDFLTRGRHEETRSVTRVLFSEERVMPEPHLLLRSDLDLVTEDLMITEVVAADLNAGVTRPVFEFQSKDEVARFATAPDNPIPLLLFTCAGNRAVGNSPSAFAAVPIIKRIAIKNRGETGVVELW